MDVSNYEVQLPDESMQEYSERLLACGYTLGQTRDVLISKGWGPIKYTDFTEKFSYDQFVLMLQKYAKEDYVIFPFGISIFFRNADDRTEFLLTNK